MHADEVETSVSLVRRLLRAQFPHWAELAIERIESSGTVNALYRLGGDMVVRLPRRVEWGNGAVDREGLLAELAPLLPVDVPLPLAKGEPGEGYACEWGVYPWLEGEHPEAGDVSHALGEDLARLVITLGGMRADGAPPSGRGSSLARFDKATRAVLTQLEGEIDTNAASVAWEEALAAPGWEGPPVWVHGDLMPANLLVRKGRLAAVIDWEGFGAGDPAVDLMLAWNLLSRGARERFRVAVGADDATWLRGRGWALWTGLVALPYYRETNPVLAENARYRIGEVLGEPA